GIKGTGLSIGGAVEVALLELARPSRLVPTFATQFETSVAVLQHRRGRRGVGTDARAAKAESARTSSFITTSARNSGLRRPFSWPGRAGKRRHRRPSRKDRASAPMQPHLGDSNVEWVAQPQPRTPVAASSRPSSSPSVETLAAVADLEQRSSGHLGEAQREQLRKLLQDYLFRWVKELLGGLRGIKGTGLSIGGAVEVALLELARPSRLVPTFATQFETSVAVLQHRRGRRGVGTDARAAKAESARTSSFITTSAPQLGTSATVLLARQGRRNVGTAVGVARIEPVLPCSLISSDSNVEWVAQPQPAHPSRRFLSRLALPHLLRLLPLWQT
ncbi:hypothetical protein Q5P01_000192, partial [Channa striata]